MNNLDLANYYVTNKNEFCGEDGPNILIELLKLYNTDIPNDNIKIVGIDIGCCVGDYLPHIKSICREQNSQIICFEPNPINIVKLEQIVKKDSHTKLFPICISNENTTTSFYNFINRYDNDIGNAHAGLRSGGEKICDVDVKKLDDVLEEEFKGDDFIIKFLKIDTEGNEGNVFEGFKKYLHKTKYIIFECSDCLDDFRGTSTKNPMKKIVDLLSENGFHTYRIGTKKLFRVNDEYWNQVYDDLKFWSDCFALKKEDDIIDKIIDNNFNYKHLNL